MPRIPKVLTRDDVDRRRLYVGIDPGQSGGIAVLSSDGSVTTLPMPTTERDVWSIFAGTNIESASSVHAVIEKVHSMPGQGVSSTFKFGVGYGGVRMALIAAGIPFSEVTPQAWMKDLSIPKRKVGRKVKVRSKTGKVVTKVVGAETKGEFKNRLKAMAQQLFPDVAVTLKTADALLIAYHCRRSA